MAYHDGSRRDQQRNRRATKSQWRMTMNLNKVMGDILSVGGIAGLVAIIITLSICARYVQNGPEPIPEVLTYALTTIIGFYFGVGIAKKTPDPHTDPDSSE
jgi:uncharacterized membrane protein YfcA